MRITIHPTFATALVIASVAVAGAQEGAQPIDAGMGDSAYPRIAVDARGGAVSVFYQSSGADWRVYANRFDPADGWTVAKAIDGAAGTRAHIPDLAVGADGYAVAAFTQWDGANWRTYANAFDPGLDSWGSEGTIDLGAGKNSLYPRIAADAEGNAVCVFTQWDGAVWRAYSNRFTRGAGWGVAAPIDAGAAFRAYDPVVAACLGSAVALFRQSDGTGDRIYANRWAAGFGWSAAAAMDGGGDYGRSPAVAMDAAGNAIAAFCESDGSDIGVYANRYVPSSGWGDPERLDDGTGILVSDPCVASDAAGNAVCLFRQFPGSAPSRIVARRFVPVEGWGEPVRIDDSDTQDSADPQVAISGNGDAVAVFRQSDGVSYHVYSCRYSGGAWGDAAPADSGMQYEASFPQVAIAPDGNATAVFTQWDGARYRAYASRLLPPPPPLIDLIPAKTTYSTTDWIVVTADAPAIAEPFYPFVRVTAPSGETLYLVQGFGLTAVPTSYLAGGPFVLPAPVTGYPVVAAQFSGLPRGAYVLEGGAVDALRTTSVDDIVYLGVVDEELLTVE